MNRFLWTCLLAALSLIWTVMPSLPSAQAADPKREAIRIRGMIHKAQPEHSSVVIPLEVKTHSIPFVRYQVLSEEEHPLASDIASDIVGRAAAIEVTGPEELLAALLTEEPGQRVLELSGEYEGGTRVFHLTAVQPLESYPPYPDCPSLPARGPADTVAVYVAEAVERPGIVCVRIINGLNKAIYGGVILGRLQHWEDGWWWRQGRFRDYQDVSIRPDGTGIGIPSLLRSLGAGEPSDERLPLSGQPAPAGRYRVCASYQDWTAGYGEASERETCSEEFTLRERLGSLP